jgi:hypothetical protein
VGQFSKNYRTFTQKIVNKLSKIWVWDPGSEIQDPGVKKAPDPGSGSATLTEPDNNNNLDIFLLIFFLYLLKEVGGDNIS